MKTALKFNKPIKLLQLAIIFVVSSCIGNTSHPASYKIPEQMNDGLATGSLSGVNIDSISILKAIARISKGKYGEVHSLLIYKDGKLVVEQYFKGHDYQWDAPEHYGPLVDWNSEMPHYAHSVSKSITSLCIGIAVDKGLIKDIHQSFFDYLPEYQYLNTGDKKYVSIENLVTCTSGLQWAEWNAPLSSMENDQVNIYFHKEGPLDYFLQKPFVAIPGTQFNYCGGGIETLGVIIENASGLSFEDFSAKYLFEPLGIKTAEWVIKYPTGEVHAAAGLRIKPRDMIKIGVMMLNGGIWQGQRIISEGWIEKSEFPFGANHNIEIPGEDLDKMGYSYTWWTKSLEINKTQVNWYSANGWGGQKIIIMPEIETVIVFTGANYTSKVKENKILEDYIFPAIK